MNTSGIYQIFCVPISRGYVGSSKNISSRWYSHRNLLKNNKHPNKYLQNSWNKYGEYAFVFKVLEIVNPPTKEILEKREDFWIEKLNSMSTGEGFNFQGGSQGTFNAEWHIRERERKGKRMSSKTFDYFNSLKQLQGIEEPTKETLINDLLRYKDSHSILIIRRKKTSNRLRVILTSRDTEEKETLYIILDPFKLTTKEEFLNDCVSSKTESRKIYQIKPNSSEIIKEFNSPKEVLTEYPQVKISALERILYRKDGNQSTKGLIFVQAHNYNPNKLYSIRKRSDVVCWIKQEGDKVEVLKKYASVNHCLKEHNLIKSTLRTYLAKKTPTYTYPFAYEKFLSDVKIGTQESTVKCDNKRVKLITIDSLGVETEYESINLFLKQHPDFRRKGIEKVLYENKKTYRGLKYKTVKI